VKPFDFLTSKDFNWFSDILAGSAPEEYFFSESRRPQKRMSTC
jgi:hypothetical protein